MNNRRNFFKQLGIGIATIAGFSRLAIADKPKTTTKLMKNSSNFRVINCYSKENRLYGKDVWSYPLKAQRFGLENPHLTKFYHKKMQSLALEEYRRELEKQWGESEYEKYIEDEISDFHKYLKFIEKERQDE